MITMCQKALWCTFLCVIGSSPVTSKDSDQMTNLEEYVTQLQNLMGTIYRQLMMQQFYVEEQTRSNGHSGIKSIRMGKIGTKPYHSASHVDGNIGSMHDHANVYHTLGLGEMIAVLNGVEFRTRHNDYQMVMKSLYNKRYGSTKFIDFPDVPPDVLRYDNATAQAAEMREWFKAWRDQDYLVRDYRPYFKPALCYLEGQWTHTDEDIEEPFHSERHFIDAKSWVDLQQKVRFTSYSGSKDSAENLAFLPTSIHSIVNDTVPILVQWNFRILCHPLSRDLPLNRLKVVDDLKTRLAHDLTLDEYTNSRAARFQMAFADDDEWVDKRGSSGLLNELMSEVPGADNYPGHIEDDLWDEDVYPPSGGMEKLNVAYYNSVYRVQKKGALGLNIRRRGFSDDNLFVAQTTNPKVAGMPIEKCSSDGNCREWFQRWTYAIPLEIIYMTPLSNWNPYNIEYKGWVNSVEGKTVTDGPNGMRDGTNSFEKAYNGTHRRIYTRTPSEFFQDEVYVDPADTTGGNTYVLDKEGNIRRTRASGIRIFIPEIPDVGTLRQRYPIMPIYGEGSSLWKEVAALKDVILEPTRFEHVITNEMTVISNPEDVPATETQSAANSTDTTPEVRKLHFQLTASSPKYGPHTHNLELSEDDAELYQAGETVVVETDEVMMHSHLLEIRRKTIQAKSNKPKGKSKGKSKNKSKEEEDGDEVEVDWVELCDGHPECADGHGRIIQPVIE